MDDQCLPASLPPTDSRRRAGKVSSLLLLSFQPPSSALIVFPRCRLLSPSHDLCRDRGQVPDGAGGGGRCSYARARRPDRRVGGHRRGGAQPGAHTTAGEGAGAALSVAGLLLVQRWPAGRPAPLQEVREHLTFALYADLAAAHKVVVVCDEAVDVLRHLEKKRDVFRPLCGPLSTLGTSCFSL